MHQPYQPPKGYEKYYELGELFPGLKDYKPIKDFAHFREVMKTAFFLYRAQLRGEVPDILKEHIRKRAKRRYGEDPGTKEQTRILEERAKIVGDRAVKDFEKAAGQAESNPEDFITERYGVFKSSLASFLRGFNEGLAGNVDLAGNVLFNRDSARLNNRPFVYIVDVQEE